MGRGVRALVLGWSVALIGCMDESEQCIVKTIGYAGSAEGPVYFIGEAADGSARMAGQSPSVATATSLAGESCSTGEHPEVAWTFQAWTDVTGAAQERCAAGLRSGHDAGHADAGSEQPGCAPLPDDPQVTVTRTLGEGRHRIHLEIEDR
jgi:hypothetical protein